MQRSSMSRTGFLAVIALGVLLIQLLPERANSIKWGLMGLAGVYLIVRGSLTYPKIYRDRKAEAALRFSDERDYRSYESELGAIREKHAHLDPDDDFSGREFRADLASLHARYAAMLERKFGRGRAADDALGSQPIPTDDQGMKG
jgi:hypothetical protein